MSNKIDTAGVKEKLLKLDSFVPLETSGILGWFGKYLAEQIPSKLSPLGFVHECYIAIFDLRDGINSTTGKPIRNKLSRNHPATYILLELDISRIAGFVFPPEFAIEVKKELERLRYERNEKAGGLDK